jgi:hypothetical protein
MSSQYSKLLSYSSILIFHIIIVDPFKSITSSMVLLVHRIFWTLTLPLPHDVNVLWCGGEAVGVPAVRRPEVDGHHH